MQEEMQRGGKNRPRTCDRGGYVPLFQLSERSSRWVSLMPLSIFLKKFTEVEHKSFKDLKL